MLFKDTTEPFFIYCRVDRQHAPETQIKIRDCFQSWLIPHFGDLELTELKAVHVLSLRQAMAAKKLGIARQYSLLMALKVFLRFCRNVLEINCIDPTTVTLPRRENPKVKYLANDEIEAIRGSTDNSRALGIRTRALFEVLLASGMRISEALSLDRSSIDFETKQASVVGKGQKPRTVFFNAESLKWVSRYLVLRQDNNPALFITYGDSPKRLTRGDIPRFFKALAKTAGIQKRLTPHLLRHTFCTNLRNNGADISLIQKLAGHHDIHVTARYYLGSDTKLLREAVEK
jgi:site-specific recombinase XerD